MDWQEVERVAKECQRTWGMGFPCISIELLEPYRATLEQALAEKTREGEGLREAGLEFYKATEALLDWMNGCDLSADHRDARPEDFKRLSRALKDFYAFLPPAPEVADE